MWGMEGRGDEERVETPRMAGQLGAGHTDACRTKGS